MPIKLKSFTALSLISFLILSCVVIFGALQPAYPDLSDKLTFQRIDGVKQQLADLKGKPLLVTFWSPDCVICMTEVTHFNHLYRELQGGDRFELLALSMYYDRPDRVIKSSQQNAMTYPVYFDLQKKLSNAFGRISATPTSFILDRNGTIVFQHTGALDFALIKQKIQQLTG